MHGIDSLTYVQPQIRDQYRQYQQKLRKYWGGGRYYKKMGRMDKVKYKQEMKDEESSD